MYKYYEYKTNLSISLIAVHKNQTSNQIQHSFKTLGYNDFKYVEKLDIMGYLK